MARAVRRFLSVGVVVLVVLLAWCWGSELVEEVLPTKETEVPALVMPTSLTSRDVQTNTFLVNNHGRYRLEVRFDLKGGPQGYQADRRVLTGLIEIEDQAGQVRLSRQVEKSFLGHEVGGELFGFDARDVGGEGLKTISLRLSVQPEFIDHYSTMTLLIRRQPRWPIVD